MDPTIFQYIGGTVTSATEAFLLPSIGRLMLAIQGLALVGTTLLIWLIGAGVIIGRITTPVRDLLAQGLKIVLVLAIALSADNYGTYVLDFFTGLESGLASALGVDGAAGDSIYALLDATLGQGVVLVNSAFRMADEAGWNVGSALAWVIAGLTIAFGTVLVGFLGGATIIMAKFALAILFALGPLFLLLLLWPITARYFDAWFGALINYTLLIVIIASVMSFALVAFGNFVGASDLTGDGVANPLLVAAEVFVLSLILAFLIWQSATLSASLAGGISIAALSVRQAMTPASMLGDALNGRSTRRDLHSGMLTSTGRLQHIAAGNTIANPAYSQHLLRQIGRNWGMPRGGRVRESAR